MSTTKKEVRTVCERCNGSGHDKNGRPKTEMVPEQQEDGTWKRKHHTIQQGSGCLWCGGLGGYECS
jgi:hypothetical protein